MLDQEPGGRVARARPLDPNVLAGLPTPAETFPSSLACFGFSDRFILSGGFIPGAVVVRFKGIHD